MLSIIANSDELCTYCNNNAPYDFDDYLNLLQWTLNIKIDFENKDYTHFNYWNYLCGYKESAHLFYINGLINETLVYMIYIYHGFKHGLERNPLNLEQSDGESIMNLPDECAYIKAQNGVVNCIYGELYSKERLNKVLKFMYTDKKYPKNGNFIISTTDGINVHLYNPCNLEILCFAKHKNLNYKLIPDIYFIETNGYKTDIDNYTWEQKKDCVFWRGSSTGGIINRENYTEIPRIKLCYETLNNPLCDIKISGWCQCDDTLLLGNLKNSRINGNNVNFKEFYKYKYLINIDGNNCAWNSMFKKLKSNSVVLHVESPNVQWYYHKLQPWVHYIPINNSLCDIHEKIQWAVEHEYECKLIVKNANKLMSQITYTSPFL